LHRRNIPDSAERLLFSLVKFDFLLNLIISSASKLKERKQILLLSLFEFGVT